MTSNLFSKILQLGLLCAILISSPLTAQNALVGSFDFPKPELEIHGVVGPTFSTSPQRPIANYFEIDKKSKEWSAVVSSLEKTISGTLFIVVRTDSQFNDEWLDFGGIKVEKAEAEIKGMKSPYLLNEPSDFSNLYRLEYQTSARSKRRFRRFTLDSNVVISELLYYNRQLSDSEKRKVESYLGLKYSLNLIKAEDGSGISYVDPYGSEPWNSTFDRVFDKEVLALGRLDSLGFYQTQTRSRDSKKITFSLGRRSLGSMPKSNLINNALLVFSKAPGTTQPSFSTLPCESKKGRLDWKIKCMNWSARVPIFMELDTLLPLNDSIVLTNGINNWRVHVTYQANYTVLKLPFNQAISDSISNETFYISYKTPDENDCNTQITLLKTDCDAESQDNARLDLIVDESLLPINAEIFLEEYRRKYTLELDYSRTSINNLPSGKYTVVCKSQSDEVIFNEVIQLTSCRPFDGYAEIGKTGYEEIVLGNQTSASTHQENPTLEPGFVVDYKNIEAFPNPANKGDQVSISCINLDDKELAVETFDAMGNLIKSENFIPTSQRSIYTTSFRVDGTYLIRFSSPDFQQTVKIKVQSNL